MATKTFKQIPLLSGTTFTGHAAEFRSRRLSLFVRAALEVGDIGVIRFFNKTALVVSSPELLHEMLVEKAKSFGKSAGIRTVLYPFAGEGLFTSGGDLWKRQRKLMAPLFQPSYMARYAEGMSESITRGIDAWREGEVIEVGKEMTRITMGVVGKALFDLDTFGEADELGGEIAALLEYISASAATLGLMVNMTLVEELERLEGRVPPALEKARGYLLDRLRNISPLPTPGPTRARAAQRRLEAMVSRMIQERRAAGLSRQDLLTKLLAARDEDDGQTMTDKQVRDEVLTLFLAGHETTAVAATWAFYLLSRHPEVERRYREEVAALGDRPPRFEDLPRLPYTLRIFKEALRLYPSAALLDRVALSDVEIGGYLLPKGTILFFSPFAIHRRPDLWPNPERFDPDRFLPEAEAARPRLAYLPFGAGPRVCIGSHFALIEGQLILAHIARRASLTPVSGDLLEPGLSTTLRPDKPLFMRVHLAPSRPESAAA
jgi:cytochrome P450